MATKKKCILVPVDFEEGSTRALESAKRLAAPLDAEVVLVHVYFPPVISYPDVPAELVGRIYEDVRAAARKALDDLAAKHGGLRAILREGEPAERILEVIDETTPIMVVMGTHGRRGLARLVLGSVAEKVIRRSPTPVLSVRSPAS